MTTRYQLAKNEYITIMQTKRRIFFEGSRTANTFIDGGTVAKLAINYRLVLLMISLLVGLTAACSQRAQPVQTNGGLPITDEIFTVVEEPPTFPGGSAGMDDFIQTHLRYPLIAIKKHVEGNVYVDFIVTKTGAIQQVHPTRGIGFWADEEAVRLVQSMPNWKPGKQAGRSVNVKYALVIPFRLDAIK